MPVAYEVVMATAICTQACFHAAGTHAVLRPQGGMLGKWSGGSGLEACKLGINYVESTVISHSAHMDASLMYILFKTGFYFEEFR